MGSSDEYYVDLEALDTVGRKLNGVLRAMTEAKSKAGHSTFLPAGTLGTGFQEEEELRRAHDKMKSFMDDQILKKLADLVDDLSQKTAKTKDAYHDREYDVHNALNPGGK
ncbi:hypothetical protein [Streptomyces chrestomyceticus]|uniref:hypothetical protein n=1 Tax=Streptomyces chrestomyceticus TaxID=68185 RepID=UPI0004C8B624|nr:hypothetical protein [Streptomyces chrestomyceticus]